MGEDDLYSYSGSQIDADTVRYANQFLIKRSKGKWYVFSSSYTVTIPEGETPESAFFNDLPEEIVGHPKRLVDRGFSTADQAMQYVRTHILHPKSS